MNNIDFTVENGRLGIITVNCLESRNVLNLEAMEQFAHATHEALATEGLRALIVTSASPSFFINGIDTQGLRQAMPTEEEGHRVYDIMVDALSSLSEMPVPVIAAIEGITQGGGCEIALACDLRVAADDATFSFNQIEQGLTPGWGGSRRLFSLVGYARAMDLLLTARTFSAIEALALGFIDRNCRPGNALKKSIQLAEAICEGSPAAVSSVKSVLHAYLDHKIGHALDIDRETFGRLWAEPLPGMEEEPAPALEGE